MNSQSPNAPHTPPSNSSHQDPLASRQFDSLDQMMAAYAEQAVLKAANVHGMNLDYSPASMGPLDTILAAEKASSSEDLNLAARLWGGYLGEVFCRHHGGEWVMAIYPGSELSMPSIQVGASQLYPLLKVQRRLTLGPNEEIAGFYQKVATALAGKSSARPAADASPSADSSTKTTGPTETQD